jgi:hypothetical protein
MNPATDTTRSMSKTSVRLAAASEHAALAALYDAWGYRAGIAPAHVVYVAERSGTVVGIVVTVHPCRRSMADPVADLHDDRQSGERRRSGGHRTEVSRPRT